MAGSAGRVSTAARRFRERLSVRESAFGIARETPVDRRGEPRVADPARHVHARRRFRRLSQQQRGTFDASKADAPLTRDIPPRRARRCRLRPSTGPFAACSGLMKCAVPTIFPGRSRGRIGAAVGDAKSVTSRGPCPPRAGCCPASRRDATMPRPMRVGQRPGHFRRTRVASAGGRGPRVRSRSPSVSPST